MTEIISGPDKRKARKDHICDQCDGRIVPGEVYIISTLKYDDLYTWKEHQRCAALADKVGHEFDEGWGQGPDSIFSWEEGILEGEDEAERIAIVDLAIETRCAPYGEPRTDNA